MIRKILRKVNTLFKQSYRKLFLNYNYVYLVTRDGVPVSTRNDMTVFKYENLSQVPENLIHQFDAEMGGGG